MVHLLSLEAVRQSLAMIDHPLIASGVATLSSWLTENAGNVFGNALSGATGSQVADFYRSQLFLQKADKGAGPAKVDAQFMATAFGVFFTSRTLAGETAAEYGLNVSDTGLGVRAMNVGSRGDAFGVADDASLTVMQLLQAANLLTDADDHISGFASIYDRNGNGVIDEEEARLRTRADELYAMIDSL